MSILRLFEDYNIPHVLPGEHQHCTEGWINVHCPFCSSTNYHLGVSENAIACHCWRCGTHPRIQVISRLLNVSIPEAKKLLRKYAGGTRQRKKIEEPRISISAFRFPQPNGALKTAHKKYLARRGFDPEQLEREWKLIGTGPVSFLDGISYNHRIVAPIYWDGKIASFQARDITNKAAAKYLACPMEREIFHHKYILYGKPEAWENAKTLIVVEGITDVWRLGAAAVATFGIEFTATQVNRLLKMGNKQFFIIFDDEPQAQKQARKLAHKLKAMNRKVYIHTVKGDPGSMNPTDARHLVDEIIR